MNDRRHSPNLGRGPALLAITVEFRVKPEAIDAFRSLLLENAAISVRDEPDCHRFDVLSPTHADDGGTFFLYELYKDRAAFAAHLASAHFKDFDQATRDLVLQKTVREFFLVDESDG